MLPFVKSKQNRTPKGAVQKILQLGISNCSKPSSFGCAGLFHSTYLLQLVKHRTLLYYRKNFSFCQTAVICLNLMGVISILIREKIKNMHMTPLRTIHTHELELNLFRWIKISALEITIFGFRLILKSCLDIIFLKSDQPSQSCCCQRW